MSVSFSPVGDFEAVCDGLQAVTLSARSNPDDQTDVMALLRPITDREVARSNGQYRACDVRVHFSGSHGFTPVPGDTVTDLSERQFTILTASLETLTDRWIVTARDLVISESLETLVTIQVADTVKGDTGAHVQTWRDYLREVRGKIQRLSAGDQEQEGSRTLERRYVLYMREQLDLRRTYRIAGPDQRIYRVTGYREPDSIDQLTAVTLEDWQ